MMDAQDLWYNMMSQGHSGFIYKDYNYVFADDWEKMLFMPLMF